MSALTRFIAGLVFLSIVSGYDTHDADLHMNIDLLMQQNTENLRDGHDSLLSVLELNQKKNLLHYVDDKMASIIDEIYDARVSWVGIPGECHFRYEYQYSSIVF